MKYLVFLLLVGCAAPAGQVLPTAEACDKRDDTIIVTPEQMAVCLSDGGCVFIPRGVIVRAIADAKASRV